MVDLPTILQGELAVRTPRVFAPGEHIVTPERRDTQVWYLHDGLVRVYSLGDDGAEHNHGFHAAGEWVHGRLLSAGDPLCCEGIALGTEALQPTRATAFRIDELDEWRRADPALADYLFSRLMTMNAARFDREAALVMRSAEQRYLDLLTKQPTLLERVRLEEIARWLGITPVALSRIRRRVRERNG